MFTPTGAVMLTLYAYRIDPTGQIWYVQADPNDGLPADSAEINVGPALLANAVGASYRAEEIDARISSKLAELEADNLELTAA